MASAHVWLRIKKLKPGFRKSSTKRFEPSHAEDLTGSNASGLRKSGADGKLPKRTSPMASEEKPGWHVDLTRISEPRRMWSVVGEVGSSQAVLCNNGIRPGWTRSGTKGGAPSRLAEKAGTRNPNWLKERRGRESPKRAKSSTNEARSGRQELCSSEARSDSAGSDTGSMAPDLQAPIAGVNRSDRARDRGDISDPVRARSVVVSTGSSWEELFASSVESEWASSITGREDTKPRRVRPGTGTVSPSLANERSNMKAPT